MKKITTFFVLIILISLTSCDTLTRYTVSVSVDRHPTLTIVNQTGHPVVVTAPVSTNTANGARTQFQPNETARSIDVIYSIEQIQFTEQVTWNDMDSTVTLTKRPPTLTVTNQTGHPVDVTAPRSSNIANEASAHFLFQPNETARSIDVIYRIGQIQFTEQVTVNNTDATATLRRPPTITVINQTGRPVVLTTPVSSNLGNGARTQFLSSVLTGNLNITYSSGLMQLTEQVTMRNQDVTVNLTVGAPTLTIVNNTGAGNNINIIQFRYPGSVAWIGGNIIIRNNELVLAEGTALAGVATQVLTNGERLNLWLGNLNLSGNAFDIRLQTPSGMIFQRDNVRIASDLTLTFSINDRR